MDREQLRAERKLRLVNPREEGSGVDFVPGGVYGFTYSPHTEGAPLFAAQGFQIFEIHKLADETVHLIGHMTEEDRAALESAASPVELKLYPEPFGMAQRLVSVPRPRVAQMRPVSREQGNWLPITVLPRS
ncbi:MAG: hypothetical protein HY235_30580 [Acidobacteria bacterium]|nr:hypothetical protein [Acidobacteriota bacterium]